MLSVEISQLSGILLNTLSPWYSFLMLVPPTVKILWISYWKRIEMLTWGNFSHTLMASDLNLQNIVTLITVWPSKFSQYWFYFASILIPQSPVQARVKMYLNSQFMEAPGLLVMWWKAFHISLSPMWITACLRQYVGFKNKKLKCKIKDALVLLLQRQHKLGCELCTVLW